MHCFLSEVLFIDYEIIILEDLLRDQLWPVQPEFSKVKLNLRAHRAPNKNLRAGNALGASKFQSDHLLDFKSRVFLT